MTVIIVSLTVAVLFLAKSNIELRDKHNTLVKKFDLADKRANMLYDANKRMKRLSIRVVKETGQ